MEKPINTNLLLGMSFLIFLFFLRVLAQLCEYFIDIPFIPDFEKWHSATLPYPILLVFQIAIIWMMIRFHVRVQKNIQPFSRYWGKWLMAFGFLYLVAMLIRHLLGLSILSHTIWFTSFLSIYFHYVLSLYILSAGYLHLKISSKEK